MYCTLDLVSFIQIFIPKGFKKKVSVKIIKNENKRCIGDLDNERERGGERETDRERDR